MDPGFFDAPVAEVAHDLIGAELLLDGVGGRIVETEAYDRLDPASHSFAGPTARNAAMFGPRGHAYVYRIYGLHWCLNVVAGRDPGAAVLIRALEPTHGLEAMRSRRGVDAVRQLCAGPGRLCQALGVTQAHDCAALDHAPFALHLAAASRGAIAVGARIGVGKGVDTPWRFGLRGSPFLSRPFPTGIGGAGVDASAVRHVPE